jgi:DNA-binding response OmpR family regulator
VTAAVLLLAEDEPMIADLIEVSLQEAGFAIVTAVSAPRL